MHSSAYNNRKSGRYLYTILGKHGLCFLFFTLLVRFFFLILQKVACTHPHSTLRFILLSQKDKRTKRHMIVLKITDYLKDEVWEIALRTIITGYAHNNRKSGRYLYTIFNIQHFIGKLPEAFINKATI